MDRKIETEIVARVLQGDRQAYALLVEEYKLPIYNLACRMTNNSEDAADLAQETFLRAFQQLSRYDTKRSFFTWLYTISLNVIRNHLKKAKRQRQTFFRNDLIASRTDNQRNKKEIFYDLEKSDELQNVRENSLETCLQKLSPELRELLILRFYQGLPFATISTITGFSQSAIKMRVYRGLEKLRKYLDEDVTSFR